MLSMDSDFTFTELLELEIQSKEPFSHCLFCLGNLPFKNYGPRKQDSSKLGLFCQTFNLTEEPFEKGLLMAPLCPNCSGLIERIGTMLESIQELEQKLNLEKQTVLELLRRDYTINRLSPKDQPPCSESPDQSSFSPVQFREDIQKKLNVCSTVPPETPSTNVFDVPLFVDSDVDISAPSISHTCTAEDFKGEIPTSDEIYDEIAIGDPGSPADSAEEDKNDPLKVHASDVDVSMSTVSTIKYTLPVGTVLRDCAVNLERLKQNLGGRKKPLLALEGKKRRSRKEKIVVKDECFEVFEQSPAAEKIVVKHKLRKEKKRVKPLDTPKQKRKYNYTPKPRDPKKTVPCKYVDSNEDQKCSSYFKDEESMLAHVRLKHLLKDSVCELCGISFGRKARLLTHKVLAHGEPYPFSCKVDGCGKGFMTQMYLRYHSYSHTGDWPFRCDKCSHGFPIPAKLEEHLATHLGNDEKNFVCEVCGKTFKSEKNVRMHRRLHKGRIHKCSLCPWSFRLIATLRQHMGTAHSDIRPYLCQECGAAYKVKGLLDRHLKLHQGVIKRRFGFRKRPIQPPPPDPDNPHGTKSS